MRLKELREASGLRQMDVAKKLNVDQSAISNWERGTARPCRKYHKKLAQIYGCNISELFEVGDLNAETEV